LKFYSEKELLNADVYDLYGLYYGFICGLKYSGGEVYLKICISTKTHKHVPDIEKIIESLRKRGVNVSSDQPIEYLIGLARQYGLDIPRKREMREIELLKSLIKPEEIIVIDKYLEGYIEKLFIVLKKPREAIYRGWRSEPEKPVPNIDYIRGKHVVSLTKGYLGVGREIVVGPGGVGLRIEKISVGLKYIVWIKFLNDLKQRGMLDIYNKLANIRDPLKYRRIDLKEYDRLLEEMEKAGIPRNIIDDIDKYIEVESGRSIYIDLPWNNILYINDIIITY